jgi:hypothetical protein
MHYPPTTYGTPVLSYYPPLRPPSAFGNKRAVLFGISYADTAAPRKLKGSVNKAKRMKQFLIDKLGFPSNSIYALTGTFSSTIIYDNTGTSANLYI